MNRAGEGDVGADPAVVSPHRRYRLLSWLLSPPLHLHLALRASRDGGARYARERLGRYGRAETTEDAPRWVHAASVGEVVTVLPLVEAALAREDAAPFLVTTNTPTGAAVLARRAPSGVRHRYLPIDRPGPVRRFLARERPRSGWIVETEIWPWLYAACRAAGVPLTIVNARLSPRTSARGRSLLAPIWRDALADVRVLARSETDAAAWRELGARDVLVETVGELKLAGGAAGGADGAGERLADGTGLAGTDAHGARAGAATAPDPRAALPPAPIRRRYALAASTHADEEERLARAWLERGVEGLLVIVPRHPERGAGLAHRLAAILRETTGDGRGVGRRALGDEPAADAPLHLADTLGELDAWYAHAAAAFVGGSLVARGGHNTLEPARRGCPIVVGPHTENFAEATARLRAADALVEVDDAGSAVDVLARALAGDITLVERGTRAREAVRDAGDVVSRYLERLLGGDDEAPANEKERSATPKRPSPSHAATEASAADARRGRDERRED